MARLHYWQYLIDESGEPINEANIYVYLANSNTSADIFTGETGGSSINSVPSSHDDYDVDTLIQTNSEGFFEFWVEDEWETIAPYNTSQKFKIAWYKTGATDGYIDYVNIFPVEVHVVDESDDDTTKNKLVSNALAKGWSDGSTFASIIKTGATQAAAGALVDEFWKTSGHATLPDNVIMIGV